MLVLYRKITSLRCNPRMNLLQPQFFTRSDGNLHGLTWHNQSGWLVVMGTMILYSFSVYFVNTVLALWCYSLVNRFTCSHTHTERSRTRQFRFCRHALKMNEQCNSGGICESVSLASELRPLLMPYSGLGWNVHRGKTTTRIIWGKIKHDLYFTLKKFSCRQTLKKGVIPRILDKIMSSFTRFT